MDVKGGRRCASRSIRGVGLFRVVWVIRGYEVVPVIAILKLTVTFKTSRMLRVMLRTLARALLEQRFFEAKNVWNRRSNEESERGGVNRRRRFTTKLPPRLVRTTKEG